MAGKNVSYDTQSKQHQDPRVLQSDLREEALRSVAMNHFATLNEQPNWNHSHRRSVLSIGPLHQQNHLTASTLTGQDQLDISPYVLVNDIDGAAVAFYHLGKKLEGYANMVHGGLIAAIMDECLGLTCFHQIPSQIAMTARLEMDFRKPVPSNSMVVVQSQIESVKGRKVWVTGMMKDAVAGTLLVEARALFVEPKGVQDVSKEI